MHNKGIISNKVMSITEVLCSQGHLEPFHETRINVGLLAKLTIYQMLTIMVYSSSALSCITLNYATEAVTSV